MARPPLIPTAPKTDHPMQLSKLASECCEYLLVRNKSVNTVAAYHVTFRQFETHITGALGLTDDVRHFTEAHVESYMLALYKAGANPNTIRTRLSSLATLAKFAAKLKDRRGRPVLAVNPILGIERPKRKRPQEKFLAPIELKAFLEVPRPTRVSIARDLLMDLSLRASELCNANVGDLITVKGIHYLSVIVKGGHPARVPISPDVADRLKDWLLERNMPDPVEPLLLDSEGNRLDRSGLAYMMIQIGKKASIRRFKVTPHVVRHTMNTIRRMAKLDPMVRSALLTHTSPQSIVSYEHLLPEELVDARAQQRLGLAAYLKSATGDYADRLCALPEEGQSNSAEN